MAAIKATSPTCVLEFCVPHLGFAGQCQVAQLICFALLARSHDSLIGNTTWTKATPCEGICRGAESVVVRAWRR